VHTDWLVSRIDQNDQIEHMVPGTADVAPCTAWNVDYLV